MIWRRILTVLLKFVCACGLLLVLLELGTRLLAPVDRFEYIPNTYDRVVGIRQLPGARGFIACPEYEITLLISEQGLRDRRFELPTPAGTRRILCLGDSFTNGFGVAPEQTFAKLLERALANSDSEEAPTRWEVINAGVAATGTAHQLAWYTADGYRYGAELVLLTFSPNDFLDSAISGLWSLSSDTTLIQHPAPRSRTLRALRLTRYLPGYATWFARSHFLNAVKQRFAQRHHAHLEQDSRTAIDAAGARHQQTVLTGALLRRLAQECQEHGARLAVQIVPPLTGSGEIEQQTQQLVAFLAAEGIDCIDLRDPFAQQQVQGLLTNYQIDGHWTTDGHRIATEQIRAWLYRSPLLAGGGSGRGR
jgi:lysophospholipase L1-like esterase